MRNSVLALLEASFSPSDLAPNIESHSSINIMDGFFSLAILKRAFMVFSVSPTYLLTKSDAETEIKVASVSVAQALARYVLPVPGGP